MLCMCVHVCSAMRDFVPSVMLPQRFRCVPMGDDARTGILCLVRRFRVWVAPPSDRARRANPSCRASFRTAAAPSPRRTSRVAACPRAPPPDMPPRAAMACRSGCARKSALAPGAGAAPPPLAPNAAAAATSTLSWSSSSTLSAQPRAPCTRRATAVVARVSEGRARRRRRRRRRRRGLLAAIRETRTRRAEGGGRMGEGRRAWKRPWSS